MIRPGDLPDLPAEHDTSGITEGAASKIKQMDSPGSDVEGAIK